MCGSRVRFSLFWGFGFRLILVAFFRFGSGAQKGAHTDSPTKTNEFSWFFKVHSPAGAATRKSSSATKSAKSKHAVIKKIHIFFIVCYVFLVSRAARLKRNQKYHPRGSPETSGDSPGSLKSINFAPRGGPGVQPIICFGSPGRPQESFGALLVAAWGPHGTRKRSGGPQAFIFDPPGSPWGAFFFDFQSFSHGFLHVLLCRLVCVVVFVLVFAPFFSQGPRIMI